MHDWADSGEARGSKKGSAIGDSAIESVSRGDSDGSQRGRRSFLVGGALALGALSSGLPGLAQARSRGGAGDQGPPPFKISLAQWSLHKELQSSRLDPRDFAKVANSLGIGAIEYVSRFYQAKIKDRKFLAELKRRAVDEGVYGLLIMVDKEGELGNPDTNARLRVVDAHKKWVEAAAYLGCHAIRVNARSEGSADEQAQLVSDGLRRLCQFADGHGISVLVENHGGLSSNGQWLSDVISAVGHPRCGTLPDFGNFNVDGNTKYDRYKGMRELMPHARAVSAKSYDFD